MNDKKRYKVLVTELHTDYVWVEASSKEEAEGLALGLAECEYDSLDSVEAVEEREL